MVIIIKIGIIDSGLGAISVLNHLINKKIYHEYFLFLDYKFNPFGEKNEKELYNRLQNAINYLKKCQCQKIVIACNTLSVVATKYNINDVIMPLHIFKNCLNKNFDKDSILLATDYTINSNVYPFKSRKSSDLVRYIEGNKTFDFSNFLDNYQKLFLGCTHFYLLKNKFKNHKIFDSGELICQYFPKSCQQLTINILLTKLNVNIKNHLFYHIHCHKMSFKVINI